MAKEIRSIENIPQEEVADILASKPTILIGSAISMFENTNLSSGVEFVNALFGFIFHSDDFKKRDEHWLKKEFINMPFEAVMECYPRQEQLSSTLLNIFRTDEYNAYHESFAEKLEQNIINSIITPNYDLTFDKKLKELNFDKFICTCNDYKAYLKTPGNVYFKIHGTAKKNFENTLIFTLSQEKNLPDWKFELLRKLIKNRIIIVIGYSGRDFDICPVLKQLGTYSKILWIAFEPDKTTSYQNDLIKAKSTNEIVKGDFSSFISRFFNKEIALNRSLKKFKAEEYFNLSDSERLHWQIKILDRLGCARYMRPVLEKLKEKISSEDYLKYKSDLYGHTGEYKKAAKVHLKLSTIQPKNSGNYIKELLYASASWLSHFSFLKAYWYQTKAERLIRNYFPNNNELEFLLLSRQIVFWSKIQQIFRPFRSRILRNINQLQNKIENFKNNASLDDRQQIRLNLDRLGISTDFSPVSGYKGYNSLGIAAMALIAYRHKIERRQWDDDEIAFYELKDCIVRAENLGMSMEVWKLCKIRFKISRITATDKKKDWVKWKNNLLATEYIFARSFCERIDLYRSFLNYKYKTAFKNHRLKRPDF